MNVFYSIITILAGLGVSLYGFNMLRQGMETSLGNGFRRTISKASKNRVGSYALSAGVTGAWQSTTLTLSMITGLLNVGNITLTQGVALMLGVGLGSALSIVLLAFQSIDLMKILSVLCVVGAFMLMFFKSRKAQKVGISIMGFGLLFAGVSLLSDGTQIVAGNPEVFGFLSNINTPVVLVLAGALISIVTNSMYATLAIITAFVGISGGGPLDFVDGVYLLVGAIASGGVMPILFCINNSSRESKAIILGYNVFKIFAAIVLLLLMFLPWINPFYDFLGHQTAIGLVLVYVVVSLVASLLLLPLSKWFGKFLLLLVPKNKKTGTVYDSFVPDENTLNVLSITLPWLVSNASKIVVMETKLMGKIINRFSEKLFVDKGLVPEVKGLEKVIRLTNNTAIRASAGANEKEIAKLNVVLNILGDASHYLEKIKKVLEIGQQYKQKPNKLTKEQLENLQKLWQKIIVIQKELENMILDATTHNMVVDNAMLIKIIALCKRNNSLNTTTRKNILFKAEKHGDFALYFDLLLAIENVNTDMSNITIKIGILSD